MGERGDGRIGGMAVVQSFGVKDSQAARAAEPSCGNLGSDAGGANTNGPEATERSYSAGSGVDAHCAWSGNRGREGFRFRSDQDLPRRSECGEAAG